MPSPAPTPVLYTYSVDVHHVRLGHGLGLLELQVSRAFLAPAPKARLLGFG